VDEIPGVVGPLSKDVDGIELFMKVIIDARPWLVEPALLPLPWTPIRIDTTEQPLKIAIMWHDDVVLPHPPITRALETMETKLGHLRDISISRWKPHRHEKAWDIISSLYYPGGGDEDADLLEDAGEPILPLTKWIREVPCVKRLTIGELQYWKEEREAYRKEYAKIWNDVAVDAILCPVGPGLAPKHGTAKYWGYTSQWNLLDYPAIVFPVGKAHADIDQKKRSLDMMTDADGENWDLCKSSLNASMS
jgi:amidase